MKHRLFSHNKRIIIIFLIIHSYMGGVRGQNFDTLNLYFDINKYLLTTEHRVQLNTLLDKYSEVTYISISGHADTTGSALYNLELSRKRAVSVKNYLFEIGLDTLIRDFNYYGEGMAGMSLQKP
ncbi:MAG TPA: OmpA family protein, partial [Bacteroidia bacterium]|nr:OmpA family protein [Bacteroidia bacterium]